MIAGDTFFEIPAPGVMPPRPCAHPSISDVVVTTPALYWRRAQHGQSQGVSTRKAQPRCGREGMRSAHKEVRAGVDCLFNYSLTLMQSSSHTIVFWFLCLPRYGASRRASLSPLSTSAFSELIEVALRASATRTYDPMEIALQELALTDPALAVMVPPPLPGRTTSPSSEPGPAAARPATWGDGSCEGYPAGWALVREYPLEQVGCGTRVSTARFRREEEKGGWHSWKAR